MWTFVQHLDGVDFKTAVQTLAGDETRLIRPAPKATAPQDDAANTARALALWEEGSPIDGTLAEEYLRRRHLEFPMMTTHFGSIRPARSPAPPIRR